MYINSIKIKNYRNYENFFMQFKEGLNVIIGANNSGKTNLLHAINLLKDLNIEIDDFNKSDLLKKYMKEYKKEAPIIEIEYEIFHKISELLKRMYQKCLIKLFVKVVQYLIVFLLLLMELLKVCSIHQVRMIRHEKRLYKLDLKQIPQMDVLTHLN